MTPAHDEKMAKHKNEWEEMRNRSPERIRKIEVDLAREREDDKKINDRRRWLKLEHFAAIRRQNILLWNRIQEDRKLHREKRVRMGWARLGSKYCDLQDLLAK